MPVAGRGCFILTNKIHTFLFADNRNLKTTFKDKGKDRHLAITPDVIHDFTDMPYLDKSFKCVILIHLT